MTPVVSIVGPSGSGKTTLLEKLIRLLTDRGYRVGVVKHDAHGFEIDHEGKDSYRHKHAGAVTVALSSADKFAVIKDVDVEWHPGRLVASYLSDSDVVLFEGFKKLDYPRIEVVRKARSAAPVTEPNERLLAYATDCDLATEKPVYGIDDAAGIADLIEEKVISPHARSTVNLVVDGRPVLLKPFVQDIIRRSVLGMVEALEGGSVATEVELRIRKR